MQDFEKLGVFYLGKAVDNDSGEMRDDLVLYDSKDLTTHAVIIGMTGSGKTGLGIGMLEEAAMDQIPVIAIDPKGDLGNLLLSFPDLSGESFLPWVNPREATEQGKTPEAYAKAQADLWRKGLGQWGQDGERIQRFRDSVDLAIYTPGSSAGLGISVLESFRAPPEQIKSDPDLYREQVQATATSILSLLGINADPITSREHILIANVLDQTWADGNDLDLGGLIAAIQQPPIEKIGVMDIDSFYPPKDRFALAMKLNNLLAAPGFEAWMQGEPLDAGRLLNTETGKPRISVLSIAHLSDTERMFFVTMLLTEVLSWVRTQPGTGSLRAILYMDEIFGYLPPTANPPSKQLFLTLLKQARAYGLGLVLSTQNPVDLDYKGLSNTGTWCIGRLQTERDKQRVMEGLEGAAAGGKFNKKRMGEILAGLGKRRFLLHNVHESEPVVFGTRWVMSYLSGPFTRDQIKLLMGQRKAAVAAAPSASTDVAARTPKAGVSEQGPPLLPAAVTQYYLPARLRGEGDLVYCPMIAGAADVSYASVRYSVNEQKRLLQMGEVEEGPVPVDWTQTEAIDLDMDDLEKKPIKGALFADCVAAAHNPRNFGKWSKSFNRWIRTEQPLSLLRSPTFKTVSEVGESEGDFRIRLQQLGNERRDLQLGKLRKKYAAKTTTLENRLMRAEQAIEREGQQAKQKKLDTAMAFGSAILGALLGRKKISVTSASKVGTAIKGVGRMRKEAGDVERAKETAAAVKQQLTELGQEFDQEVAKLNMAFNAQDEELPEVLVKAKSTDINIHFVALAWAPYYRAADGSLSSAWV
jgi:hypothetical protein